jgi:hypothetical protein
MKTECLVGAEFPFRIAAQKRLMRQKGMPKM